MQTNNTDVHSQYLGHTESAPTQGVCALLVYHCLSSRLLYRELSEAGPGLHALPRSKLLRFRFSDTPQRHRLGWACVCTQTLLSRSEQLR